MRIVVTLGLLALLSSGTAMAETSADRFAPQRGVNLELWVTWPKVEEMVSDPDVLSVFPEWRRHVPPTAIEGLALAGFDHVRLSIEPAPFLRLGPGPAQDALIEQVVQTTTMLQDKGLNVIVDLHTIPRWGEAWGIDAIISDALLFDSYASFVGHMSAALAPLDPDRTALELINEPTNDCGLASQPDQQQWPDQLVRLHEAARSAAPALPLIVQGGCWGSADGLVAMDPAIIADDNVIWTFHTYGPFFFTHQGAGWTTGPQLYFSSVPFPPSDIDDASAHRLLSDALIRVGEAGDATMTTDLLREALQAYRDLPPDAATEDIARVADWAKTHGIPPNRVYVGEFGVLYGAAEDRLVPEADRAAFLDTKVSAIEAAGFAWAVASWTGTLAIADPVSFEFYPGPCRALRLKTC